MRHTLIALLAVITLLSQWGWVEHGYHDHSADEVCEACISAPGHLAVTQSANRLPGITGSEFLTPALSTSFFTHAPRFYPTRAPPQLL